MIKSETRDNMAFTSMDVSGDIRCICKTGFCYSVKVETDENLQEYIEVIV